MGTVLTILDFLVVLSVVISVARAVLRGRSRVLAGFIIAAMIIFGTVSFTAANGLTGDSPFNQWTLLIFLVAIAIVVRASWAKEPGSADSVSEAQQRSTVPSRP